MTISKFLGRVLMLDALSCLAMGAALAAAAEMLAPLFGLTRDLILGAGVVLIPIGLFILWTGTRKQVPALFVYAIIVGNGLWVAESLLTAASSATITPLGSFFVIAQAAAVALITALEIAGVARLAQAPQVERKA